MNEIDELIEKYEGIFAENKKFTTSGLYKDGKKAGKTIIASDIISDLKQLKASLQPVVPVEVAEWYEECNCGLEDKMIIAQYEVESWYYDLGEKEAQRTIAKMDLFGYTVAK